MEIEKVTESEARRILRSLRTGTAPTEYAREIFVGQAPWFATAVELMEQAALDEDFEVRFIRAPYGGGKTIFLRCLEAAARGMGWVTAYVLLKHGSVELDRFETCVREIGNTLVLPDGNRGLGTLLHRAVANLAMECGFDPNRTNSLAPVERAHQKIDAFCNQKGIDYDVSLALRSAIVAYFERDPLRVNEIAKWIGGGSDKLSVEPKLFGSNPHRLSTRASATHLKPLGASMAEQLLRLLALLTKLSGHKGLLLSLDEIELIGTLPDRRRENALQTLRVLVDHTDPGQQPPSTSLFVAATPEMFENPKMFPKYKALQDRIDRLPTSLGGAINWRGTVIDLDLTKLGDTELSSLAERIIALYRRAGHSVSATIDTRVKTLVSAITSRQYMIARPRLLCRCVLDILDGGFGDDVPQALASRIGQLQQQREHELKGEP